MIYNEIVQCTESLSNNSNQPFRIQPAVNPRDDIEVWTSKLKVKKELCSILFFMAPLLVFRRDWWLLKGLALYLTNIYTRRAFGNNEYRYNLNRVI